MGLFDFFFGGGKRSNVNVVPDVIWLNNTAKLKGIRKDVVHQRSLGAVGLLLVAHFDDVLEQLFKIAAEHGNNIPIKVSLAKDLSTDLVSEWSANESATIAIIIGERHPLPKHDDEVLQFAESLPHQVRLIRHISLEDPLMKAFAGEWVKKTLQSMGMAEDEAIESQMVSRRIKAAQQKIEKEAFGDSDAGSAAEWLDANVPGMRSD
ncbi:MAG: preprotein translocase subunit SecA [Pirellulaceae bacterium]